MSRRRCEILRTRMKGGMLEKGKERNKKEKGEGLSLAGHFFSCVRD